MSRENEVVERMIIGARYLYVADKSVPYEGDLDAKYVTVLSQDEAREDFDYWIEDDEGNGSWAAERELHLR